ncbi:MAG: 3-carboxy-cis,cis-muconate cycloisomerase [Nitratireductor sp.]
MSYTPFNAPILAGLLGDREIAACFSVKVEAAAWALFESALARSQAGEGLIPADAARAIAQTCAVFEADMAKITDATARDGVAIPEFVRQLRAAVGEPHSTWLHKGATSQDVIDTSLILRLRPVVEKFRARLDALQVAFDSLDFRFGAHGIMARTRMQSALPVNVSRRIRDWREPLARHVERLGELSPRLLSLQLGGPAGTLSEMDGKGEEVAIGMAGILGLAAPTGNWHAQRDSIAEFASLLSLISGTLGKFGQDIALMAQNEFGEVALSGAGGSSAMAHKQNPVKAEALVTLARFNATLVGGMHHTLVHEQERSGSAWALEWMLLPQVCVATGASLRLALELAGSVTAMGREPD